MIHLLELLLSQGVTYSWVLILSIRLIHFYPLVLSQWCDSLFIIGIKDPDLLPYHGIPT